MAGDSASSREKAKSYLSSHKIPQMFESLLSCLMLERPEDPVSYIETKMTEIKQIGLDNVNWETFVMQLHPYRNEVRRNLIHDGSKFDKEKQEEYRLKNELLKGDTSRPGSDYKPQVFQLTESQ